MNKKYYEKKRRKIEKLTIELTKEQDNEESNFLKNFRKLKVGDTVEIITNRWRWIGHNFDLGTMGKILKKDLDTNFAFVKNDKKKGWVDYRDIIPFF